VTEGRFAMVTVAWPMPTHLVVLVTVVTSQHGLPGRTSMLERCRMLALDAQRLVTTSKSKRTGKP